MQASVWYEGAGSLRYRGGRARRTLVARLGNDLQQYAQHAGNIGGATHLVRCGVTAMQSRFRARGAGNQPRSWHMLEQGGERTEVLSRVLTRNTRMVEG